MAPVNPDLLEERGKPGFDSAALQLFINGENHKEYQKRVEDAIAQVPSLNDALDVDFLNREERYENAVRKAVVLMEHRDWISEGDVPNMEQMFLMRQSLFAQDSAPFELHYAMFLPTLQSQASDEQLEKWLPPTLTNSICGTYAQTELGHGTNLKNLEMTSTYCVADETFELHCPTLTAIKWWPGNLGKSSNYAIVQAQLWIKAKCYGPHLFIVQLRDLDTHQPLSGITVGDIGPKMGFVSVDNGFLRLDRVKIPRDQMLMRHSQVLKDGTYVSPPHSKVNYAGMLWVRAMMIHDLATALAKATTIAVRYSCVRRQGEIKPGAGEVKLLDYQNQQYKLVPLIASSLAYILAGRYIRDIFQTISTDVRAGNVELLPELHALAAGLKSQTSWDVTRGVEICRLACGGHGYSLASRLPQIYNQVTPACTYEGDNTVMLLQVARYLVKAMRESEAGHLRKTAAYLSRPPVHHSALDQTVQGKDLVAAYEHVARRLVAGAVEKLDRAQARGLAPEHAWNANSIELSKAAKAHVNAFVVRNFHEMTATVESPSVLEIMTKLFRLHAVYGIYRRPGKFLEDSYLSAQQMCYVRECMAGLLADLRPHAVPLVDCFGFTDRQLSFSILGRYDGQVYENLYKWAAGSPLNKKQVLDAYHKYLGPAMKQARSKL